MHSLDDTIAAIATAASGAARGIVRISGPDVPRLVQRLFQPTDGATRLETQVATAIPGTLTLADLEARRLPCDLYLWPDARSYTRQPVAELHTLGSPPLLEALLRAVCVAGARVAGPGEFTLRAFLAGRIDLVQAEAVLGVIDAADGREMEVALAQLAGGLTRPLVGLRDQLLDLLADLEAGLDFVEEDIRFIGSAELHNRLSGAARDVARLVEQMHSRQRSDVEPRVVLVGSPNVGKSSLFNALLARSAALVASQPGTTRDYLTGSLQIGELNCILTDTAGQELRSPSADPLDDAAQQVTVTQRDRAHLRLLCLDSTRPMTRDEEAELTRDESQLVVLTKCDASGKLPRCAPAIATSALTGAGLDRLKAAIHARLAAVDPSAAEAVAATTARCHESLRLADECLVRAANIASSSGGDELVAAEVRTALSELGRVAGTVYTDDVLDRIFSRFCIGK